MSTTPAPRFLTAAWRNLAMLNYEIDPAILAARVPVGCELDAFDGRTFVSVVGFQFLETRVLGIAVPWHRNFEEVNLRFYVRRKADGEWRRGVVFVKELVPRRAIAFVAHAVYGENYAALPMRHTVARADDGVPRALRYEWRRHGSWEGLFIAVTGMPVTPSPDSEEAFITEHYWGYSKQRLRGTIEYQVEHPRWGVWRADASELSCDVASLYGTEFVAPLSGAPRTAFVADGSAIVVRKGRRLVAAIIVALSGLFAHAAPPTAPTLDQIRAASVRGVVQGKTVKLKNGAWEGAPFVRGGTERPKVALLERFSTTGNIDDTAAEERVVLLTQSAGGTGDNLFLAVFGLRGGRIKNLATVLVGDRTQPSMLAVGGGMIFLDVVEPGPTDAACCPTQPARKTYRFGHDGLEPVTGVSSLPLPRRSAVSLSAVSEFRSTMRPPC